MYSSKTCYRERYVPCMFAYTIIEYYLVYYTRCPNGEFRLCCLYSPLRPSLSLLSPLPYFPSAAISSLPPSLPPSKPHTHSLSLSVSYSPSLNLRSFYCFCLSAFLCVRESLCEGESETEIEIETERHRDRDTERLRYRQSERERERYACLRVRMESGVLTEGGSAVPVD